MNRKELFKKLEEIPLEKKDFIILAGASLLAQKIRKETFDIDVAVEKKAFEKIKKLSNQTHDFNGITIIDYKDMEFSDSSFDLNNVKVIDGYNFANLESILEFKKKLNREKDKKDIKKIELALMKQNNYKYEQELIDKGITLIAGVDEVGRGPLVGPVVAAAVILPLNYKLEGLTDSKMISEKKREEYAEIIKKDAISYGIGVIDNNIIDEVNIYEATKLAMYDAINKLNIKPEHILIDAMKLDLNIPSTSLIKGDIKSLSISAASVIAKVYRDNLMYELDKKYPYYNFKKNKGYPTKDHVKAIEEHGILKEHRKTYGKVKEYVGK